MSSTTIHISANTSRSRIIVGHAMALLQAAVVAAALMTPAITAHAAESKVIFAELKNPLSSVSHIASAQRYPEKYGISVQVVGVESGPDVVASLKSRAPGAAQTGNLALEPVAAMIAAGSDPVVLATLISTSDHIRIVTFKAAGVTADPRTLRGKRVGVTLDTNGESYLSRLLQIGGLSRSDLVLINSRPTEIRAALVRGDIDAGVLWDPFLQQALRLYQTGLASGKVRDRGEALVFVNPDVYTTRLNVVTTKRHLATSRPQLVALLRSMNDAGNYINADRSRARTLMEDWLGLQRGDLNDFFKTARFEARLNTPVLKAELGLVLERLKSKDRSAVVPADLAPYIDTSLLGEINPSFVTQ